MTALPLPVCILGPTASGKTALALRLAEEYPVLLISVDSAMVYRGMDIGTGKPSPELLLRHPHALVDVRDPTQEFSVGEFVREAAGLLERADEEGRIPVFVGGTMLYYDRLFLGLAPLPRASAEVRAGLREEARCLGWPALHARLAALDPVAAAALQPKDAARIERALEVWELTGQSPRQYNETLGSPGRPLVASRHCLAVALDPLRRSELYERIDRRLDRMVREGMLEEIARLRRHWGVTPGHPSQRVVGYRQMWPVLEGRMSVEDGIGDVRRATRALARRQLSWLRRMDRSGLHPRIRRYPGPEQALEFLKIALERT